jgi:hypothetical protein
MLIFRMFEQVPTYAFLIVIIIGLKLYSESHWRQHCVQYFYLRDERSGESVYVKRIGKQSSL